MDDAGLIEAEEWRAQWSKTLETFEHRPAMYIDNLASNHFTAIWSSLLLIYRSRLFRKPHITDLHVSPNQFATVYRGGELIRPVRRCLSVRGKRILSDNWRKEFEGAADHLDPTRKIRKDSWRYTQFGPTGPRLDWAWYTSIAGGALVWGVRTNEGLWCQAFLDGCPTSSSFQVDADGVQFFVAAELNSRWFQGLPFTENDVPKLRVPERRIFNSVKATRKGHWSTYRYTDANVRSRWHERNEILNASDLTSAGVEDMLNRLSIVPQD